MKNQTLCKVLTSAVLSVSVLVSSIIPANAAPLHNGRYGNLNDSSDISENSNQNSETPFLFENDYELNAGSESEETSGDSLNSQPDFPDESSDPDDELSSELPETAEYTVTYYMGDFGTETETVAEGEYPAHVPQTFKKGYRFTGWINHKGSAVDPASVEIFEDSSFYAQYERHYEDLLLIDTHKNYISGYDNGMFKPDGNISRKEVAQIFYMLLQDTDWELSSFPDVKSDSWYARSVETLASMGVISGYDDGKFYPDKSISRAEFVSIAVNFDTATSFTTSFSDVPSTHWAVNSIATASSRGWISGYEGNVFKPENFITRAETVSIINIMLKRQKDAANAHASTAKNFFDVYSSHWAHGHIVEASTVHTYNFDENGKEVWLTYETEPATTTGKWVYDSGKSYYVNPETKKFAQGFITIDGKKYLFDESTRTPFNGFRYMDEWKRYFKDGLPLDDISGLGLVSGPYYIKVYKPGNYLTIFAKDGDKGYTIPVKAMITSCGVSTPTGSFNTPNKYRWLRMIGFTWAQWCTQISGSYLFHSVPDWTQNNLDLEVDEYNRLGTTRSAGCIRLTSGDAKWIYDNCNLGTSVFISGIETSGPLPKPTSLKIPSWHTWDPTDPTAAYKCKEHGCHSIY